MSNRKLVTDWGKPTDMLESQYGTIPYREWCQREAERINQRGDGVRIVVKGNGLIALSR